MPLPRRHHHKHYQFITGIILGRVACIAPMRPIETDVTRSMHGLFVGHTGDARKNGRTDPDAVWGG